MTSDFMYGKLSNDPIMRENMTLSINDSIETTILLSLFETSQPQLINSSCIYFIR